MENNCKNKTLGKTGNDLYIWTAIVLLTLPHLNPGYLNQFVVTEIAINIGRVVSALVILVLTLFVKKKVSLIVLLIGVQQGYVLCNTILRGGAIRNCLISLFSVISVILLYDLMQDKRNIFLSAQLFCFEIVIYINLVLGILYPDTLYVPHAQNTLAVQTRNWFLGAYNCQTQYFLPALMTAFLYKQENGKRLRVYLLTLAIYISTFIAWSGGMTIALLGVAIVYVVFKNWTKVFHYFSYWLIPIFFFVMVIVLKFQNLFKWLIDGVLGKWDSLNGRMRLWDMYIEWIGEKFIFGHGVEYAIIHEQRAGMNWASYAHNQLLEIMYQGGVINLVLFTVIIIVAGKTIYKYRDTKESKIIAVAFLGWCLHGLVEAFTAPFLMAMFVSAYYSNGKCCVKVLDCSVECWRELCQRSVQRILTKVRKKHL